MKLSFQDKTVLITGGSEGIGFAAAAAFGKAGARVAICGRNPDKLEQAETRLKDMGVKTYAQTCDVAKTQQFREFADHAERQLGAIDVFINNAGYMPFALLKDMEEETLDAVLDINLKSVFTGSKIAFDKMHQRGGVILNASSFASVIPTVGYSAYAAAKAAVASLTKTAASEFAPYGIRVLGYIPGLIDTALTKESQRKNGDALLAPIAARRYGTPDDIANVLLFLASDFAGYMTGTCIEISGGKFSTQNPMQAWELA